MTGNMDNFQQAMNQGHSAAWDQKWDQAAKFYQQALEEFPDDPGALTGLGFALFELEDYEQSIQNYIQVARLAPDDPFPLEKISQLYERLGNSKRAQQAAFKSAELFLKSQDVDKNTA